MGYSRQIIKGFSWAACLNAGAMGISLVKIVILSHFVFGPAEFGVFGIGVMLLGILELLTETGINIFLVQEEEPVESYLDTAWVVSIFRGFLIGIVVAMLSYPIVLFFKITSYWVFILAFSLIPIIRGFINPAIVNLQKKLHFKQDAFYRFITSLIGDACIIILAVATHSLFSFVIGMMVSALLEVVITFVFVKERPRFRFKRDQLKRIISRGKSVTFAQIFDFLFEHSDDLVVGRLLNVFSLGIYQNSYVLSSLPENAIAQQLGRVTFPIFVNIREDKQRVKKGFWRSFWITLAVVAPFGFALFFLSDPLIRLFLGMKWLAAIPVLRVLALFSIARAVVYLFYPVFLAYKKQKYVMTTTLVSWVTLLVFVIPLTASYGVVGAATSALLGSLAGIPVAFILFNRIFNT